jgi:hypothetical protein
MTMEDSSIVTRVNALGVNPVDLFINPREIRAAIKALPTAGHDVLSYYGPASSGQDCRQSEFLTDVSDGQPDM